MTTERKIPAIYSVKAMHPLFGKSLAVYMRLLGRTCSFEVIGEENHAAATAGDVPALYISWHEQLMPFISYAMNVFNLNKLVTLIEGGDRGLLLRYAVLGVGGQVSVPVQYQSGSLSGGRNLLSLIRKMKGGMNGFMAPDGPDGPCFKAKPGAMFIAKKSGAKVLPTGTWMERGTRVNRWDQYMVPFPFTKITVAFGKPFVYTDDYNEESFTAKIADSLNAVRETARKGRNN